MKKLPIIALIFFSLTGSAPRANAQVNYNLVCVDSVWYDTGNPQFINVRIYNGDTIQMNYPSVQIVSPANDTVGNPSNFVNWFAHLQNTYQVYTDTITQPGIPDFSNYTFVMHEGFGASTGIISWCNPLSIEESAGHELEIFPNPLTDELYVTSYTLFDIDELKIYDAIGNQVLFHKLKAISQKQIAINVTKLSPGIYFIRATDGKNISRLKFVKQ